MCLCGQNITDSNSGVAVCCERLTKFKADWARQVDKDYFEPYKKVEKNKVASAYRPKEEEIIKAALNTVPPNETPREELLQRDVGLLLDECRDLRAENKRLLELNKILTEQNEILFNTLKNGLGKPNNANV